MYCVPLAENAVLNLFIDLGAFFFAVFRYHRYRFVLFLETKSIKEKIVRKIHECLHENILPLPYVIKRTFFRFLESFIFKGFSE